MGDHDAREQHCDVTADADGPVHEVRREHARRGTDHPVRVEKTPPEEEEMGGEAPCQLHRFWDAEE